MLWLIGMALLASYFISATAFQTVAVLSLIMVAFSIIATVVGLRTVDRDPSAIRA
jgi:hypothetical protein